MQHVSDKYKDAVYTTEFARHFIPQVVVKAVDVNAHKNCHYTSTAGTIYSNLAQVIDDIYEDYDGYGTCEYCQYLLDGSMKAFSFKSVEEGTFSGQIGFMSAVASDTNGNFLTEVSVTCTYDVDISTAGRTLFFNDKDQSFPTAFTIQYFHDNVLKQTVEVTDNNSFMYISTVGVLNYNKVKYTFHNTKNPESMVKLVEDIPGIFLRYEDDKVVTLAYTGTIDILSDELLTGEFDIDVKNDTKEFNILNSEGISKYIQRRQETDIGFKMIYPDNTSEKVKCNTAYITAWKDNSTDLTASFTARDVLDKLFQADYIKGMYTSVLTNYYDMAKAVLDDAGVEDYIIDNRLKTMYTYGIPPISNHKEILRMIAQATQSVILPTIDGSVEIRYIGIPTVWPAAVDELDYSILIDPPTVTLADAYKSVTTNMYAYTVAAAKTEVYKEVRTITGTEEMTLKYTKAAKDCSVVISAGTLVSAVYYTNAAVLKISTTTATSVTITISGYEISSSTSPFKVDNSLDPNLIPDAREETVDNPLITQETVARGVSNYRAYWRTRRYQYKFDWRQNPAMDLFDPVIVHDDFDKNYVTLIVEQNLDFQSGALDGSSRSIY